MNQIFDAMKEKIEKGENTVLATITASSGATPRGIGSHMLVDSTGRIAGTIGGGMIEHRSIRMAQEALEKGEPLIHDFALRRNEVEDLGMICGGDVTVDFRILCADDQKLRDLVQAATDENRIGKRAWLIASPPTEKDSGLSLLYADGGIIGSAETMPETWKEELSGSVCGQYEDLTIGGIPLHIEEIQSGARVLVFGGGHVAQALVPILASVGFQSIVLEDRDDFAQKSLFPHAAAVKKIDFYKISEEIFIRPEDYVCVMTRGHAFDEIIQDQVLRTEAQYIGVIGSKAKKATIDAHLHKRGHSWETIARIVSPIGIDIGGRTPEEIAISITGELIAKRAGREIGEK